MRDVLSLGTTKEAALYFDRVLPDDLLAYPFSRHDESLVKNLIPLVGDTELTAKILTSLIPEGEAAFSQVLRNMSLSAVYLSVVQSQATDLEDSTREWHQDQIKTFMESAKLPDDFLSQTVEQQKSLLKKERSSLLKRFGFFNAAQWIDPKFLGAEGSTDYTQSTGLICSLKDLHLIDANSLSWDEICEFRSDERSRSDLRRLRIFLTENFDGKEEAYIRDKLEEALDEYESATRRWGFKTAIKSLSVAFSNESAIASVGGGVLMLAGGAPLTMVAAASTIFPLGKVSVEITRNWVDDRKLLNSSPIKYLSTIKKLVPSTPPNAK